MRTRSFYLFYGFLGSLRRCFSGNFLWGHLAAIVLTFLLVHFGFDWYYYRQFHDSVYYRPFYLAPRLGFTVPVLLPLTLLLLGFLFRRVTWKLAGWMLGQAALMGLFVSTAYKFFTGRPGPEFRHQSARDITHVFRFGLMRGGLFWGWPSSHTTVAFSMGVSLFVFARESRWVRMLALAYACYIGIGVSMSIHWFSDFIAGTIIGSMCGMLIGQSFSHLEETLQAI